MNVFKEYKKLCVEFDYDDISTEAMALLVIAKAILTVKAVK